MKNPNKTLLKCTVAFTMMVGIPCYILGRTTHTSSGIEVAYWIIGAAIISATWVIAGFVALGIYAGKHADKEISDGFGNSWSAVCPLCHRESMQVVRPGKVQCTECGNRRAE